VAECAQDARVAVVADRGGRAQALGERGVAESAQECEPSRAVALREAGGGEREQRRAQQRSVGLRRESEPGRE
jgi:hypothetical protein